MSEVNKGTGGLVAKKNLSEFMDPTKTPNQILEQMKFDFLQEIDPHQLIMNFDEKPVRKGLEKIDQEKLNGFENKLNLSNLSKVYGFALRLVKENSKGIRQAIIRARGNKENEEIMNGTSEAERTRFRSMNLKKDLTAESESAHKSDDGTRKRFEGTEYEYEDALQVTMLSEVLEASTSIGYGKLIESDEKIQRFEKDLNNELKKNEVKNDYTKLNEIVETTVDDIVYRWDRNDARENRQKGTDAHGSENQKNYARAHVVEAITVLEAKGLPAFVEFCIATQHGQLGEAELSPMIIPIVEMVTGTKLSESDLDIYIDKRRQGQPPVLNKVHSLITSEENANKKNASISELVKEYNNELEGNEDTVPNRSNALSKALVNLRESKIKKDKDAKLKIDVLKVKLDSEREKWNKINDDLVDAELALEFLDKNSENAMDIDENDNLTKEEGPFRKTVKKFKLPKLEAGNKDEEVKKPNPENDVDPEYAFGDVNAAIHAMALQKAREYVQRNLNIENLAIESNKFFISGFARVCASVRRAGARFLGVEKIALKDAYAKFDRSIRAVLEGYSMDAMLKDDGSYDLAENNERIENQLKAMEYLTKHGAAELVDPAKLRERVDRELQAKLLDINRGENSKLTYLNVNFGDLEIKEAYNIYLAEKANLTNINFADAEKQALNGFVNRLQKFLQGKNSLEGLETNATNSLLSKETVAKIKTDLDNFESSKATLDNFTKTFTLVGSVAPVVAGGNRPDGGKMAAFGRFLTSDVTESELKRYALAADKATKGSTLGQQIAGYTEVAAIAGFGVVEAAGLVAAKSVIGLVGGGVATVGANVLLSRWRAGGLTISNIEKSIAEDVEAGNIGRQAATSGWRKVLASRAEKLRSTTEYQQLYNVKDANALDLLKQLNTLTEDPNNINSVALTDAIVKIQARLNLEREMGDGNRKKWNRHAITGHNEKTEDDKDAVMELQKKLIQIYRSNHNLDTDIIKDAINTEQYRLLVLMQKIDSNIDKSARASRNITSIFVVAGGALLTGSRVLFGLNGTETRAEVSGQQTNITIKVPANASTTTGTVTTGATNPTPGSVSTAAAGSTVPTNPASNIVQSSAAISQTLAESKTVSLPIETLTENDYGKLHFSLPSTVTQYQVKQGFVEITDRGLTIQAPIITKPNGDQVLDYNNPKVKALFGLHHSQIVSDGSTTITHEYKLLNAPGVSGIDPKDAFNGDEGIRYNADGSILHQNYHMTRWNLAMSKPEFSATDGSIKFTVDQKLVQFFHNGGRWNDGNNNFFNYNGIAEQGANYDPQKTMVIWANVKDVATGKSQIITLDTNYFSINEATGEIVAKTDLAKQVIASSDRFGVGIKPEGKDLATLCSVEHNPTGTLPTSISTTETIALGKPVPEMKEVVGTAPVTKPDAVEDDKNIPIITPNVEEPLYGISSIPGGPITNSDRRKALSEEAGEEDDNGLTPYGLTPSGNAVNRFLNGANNLVKKVKGNKKPAGSNSWDNDEELKSDETSSIVELEPNKIATIIKNVIGDIKVEAGMEVAYKIEINKVDPFYISKPVEKESQDTMYVFYDEVEDEGKVRYTVIKYFVDSSKKIYTSDNDGNKSYLEDDVKAEYEAYFALVQKVNQPKKELAGKVAEKASIKPEQEPSGAGKLNLEKITDEKYFELPEEEQRKMLNH